MRFRNIWALGGLAVSTLFTAPVAPADPGDDCAAILGAGWSGTGQDVCRAETTSSRNALATMTIQLPKGLLARSPSEPVLGKYLDERVSQWRASARDMVRDSNYRLSYQQFDRAGLASVVFEESRHTVGTDTHRAIRTFTFDLAAGRQLELADLFRPGLDPLVVLPDLVRPYLEPVLDAAPPAHASGTYPFVAQEWEPQPDGSGYSGEYRAFALTPNDLILYLPDVPLKHESPWPRDRFVWSMNGGTVVVRVPLSALDAILAV